MRDVDDSGAQGPDDALLGREVTHPPAAAQDRAAILQSWVHATIQGDLGAAARLDAAVHRWALPEADASRLRAILRRFAKGVRSKQAPELTGSAAVNRTGYSRARAGNWSQARELFDSAAEQGSAGAANNLAYCLERGLGGGRHLSRAAALYDLSGAQGSAAALVNRAHMARFGLGQSASLPAAIELLRRAHALGDAEAGQALVYLVYTAQATGKSIGLDARGQAAAVCAAQAPSLRPPWVFELRGAPEGSRLSHHRWQMLRALGPMARFALWEAPLDDAFFADERGRCPCCGKVRLLLEHDERAVGCFLCLARRRFANPSGLEAADPLLAFTPSASTWNMAAWFHHCGRAAIFLGAFTQEEFHYHAHDGDGEALFASACDLHAKNYSQMVPRSMRWDGLLHHTTWLTFRCRVCGTYKTYLDSP